MVGQVKSTGDAATLRADFEPTAELTLDPGGPIEFLASGPRRIASFYRKAGYVQQLDRFLSDDWTDLPQGDVGRDVLEVICAAYASDGAGANWVDLPFAGPRDGTPYELRAAGSIGRFPV